MENSHVSQPPYALPSGDIQKYQWQSKIFAGTTRDYWIYVPAPFNSQKPLALMVFQDGQSYIDDLQTPAVLDMMIDKKAIPPLIGLFINPGQLVGPSPDSPFTADNRSYEYDTLSDEYARFLIDEMIPEVGRKYNLADSAKMRALVGFSSGGICAFTAAWQRPDYFHKVLSHCGSFANIRGGHVYPSLIRRSSKRSIRVFLQAGSSDIDSIFGNWWLSNLQMESALKFRAYDYKFVAGSGGHDMQHGKSILPQTLEWLWRPDQD